MSIDGVEQKSFAMLKGDFSCRSNALESACAKHPFCFLSLIAVILLGYIFIYSEPGFQIPVSADSNSETDSLNYAVVIDAGSSGSRAYLYVWPEHSGDPKSLLKIDPLLNRNGEPIVKSISPGLSSLGDKPSGAGDYIANLLDFASEAIPEERHTATHLFILATAGMRLLSQEKQNSILTNLRQSIRENYRFLFPEKNLEVISGTEEGIYQWISINYVLGKLDPSKRDSSAEGSGPRTVGAIDMGGASLQIAMEISSDHLLESLSTTDKNHIDSLNLGTQSSDADHTYKVFVTTFLGYGANEALSRHRRKLILSQLEGHSRKPHGLSPQDRLHDPCLPKGLQENVTLSIDPEKLSLQDGKRTKKLFGPATKIYLIGTGDWNECYIELSQFIRSRETFLKSCSPGEKTCPDAGIQRPPIDFDTSEFYAFSEFWYTAEDVLRMGGVYTFDKFRRASQDFCSQDWSVIFEKFSEGSFPQADLERMKTQCFKSAWVVVALHQGLAFPENYSRLTAAPNSLNGRVIHWTLGALLYRTRFLPKDFEMRLLLPVQHQHHLFRAEILFRGSVQLKPN